MSLILKGIDMPGVNETRMIAITQNGVAFFSTVKDGETSKSEKAEAIQIPKKHGTWKDINAIYRAFSKYAEKETDEGKLEVYAQLMGLLVQAPTALEEEEKEGSWIPVDSYSTFGGDEETWEAHGNPIAYHYCSECKNQVNVNEFGEELLTDYCPYCGAKMKGK